MPSKSKCPILRDLDIAVSRSQIEREWLEAEGVSMAIDMEEFGRALIRQPEAMLDAGLCTYDHYLELAARRDKFFGGHEGVPESGEA